MMFVTILSIESHGRLVYGEPYPREQITDGCTDGGALAGLSDMADWFGILGNVNMTPECDTHDVCYATIGKGQLACDDEFHLNMRYECARELGGELKKSARHSCYANAKRAYVAVKAAGEPYYDGAQFNTAELLSDYARNITRNDDIFPFRDIDHLTEGVKDAHIALTEEKLNREATDYDLYKAYIGQYNQDAVLISILHLLMSK
jgi:hypothetical protein